MDLATQRNESTGIAAHLFGLASVMGMSMFRKVSGNRLHQCASACSEAAVSPTTLLRERSMYTCNRRWRWSGAASMHLFQHRYGAATDTGLGRIERS